MLSEMPRFVVSLLVLAAAVAACLWFALGIRQSHDLNVATAIISSPSPVSAVAGRQAGALLRRAGRLNPDASVDLARSALALREGDAARARALALSVTRSEPQNLEAWLAYGSASAHDPQAFALALRHLNALAPTPRGS
jgi:hypothetical protein